MTNPIIEGQKRYDAKKVYEKNKADLSGCLDAFGTLALAPVFVVVNGWALQHLWAWFMEPFGAPEIGILHAAGLALTARFLITRASASDEPIKFGVWLFRSVAFPPMAVGLGWLIHHFML